MNSKFLILLFLSILCPQLISCEQGHTTPLLVSHPHRSIRSLRQGTNHRIKIGLAVFGENVILNLIPNHNLIHPNYASQHLDSNSNIVSQSGVATLCHYTGHVECVDCGETRAFVSTCHGELRGLFSFNQTDHFIEPLLGPHGETHIVYTQVAEGGNYSEVLHHSGDWLGQVAHSQLRSVRSSALRTRRYYLESLVVLDGTMVSHHGSSAESYVLTIMNIVAGLLSQPFTGQPFFLVVSRLITTSPGSDTFTWNSDNPGSFLPNFCEWQHRINGEHDLALFFTRRSLCRGNCFVLGRAYVSTLCSGRFSCLMVREQGLMLAGTTVSHEMGHLFGSSHDEDSECGAFGVPAIPSIMSHTVTTGTNHFKWSECSKHSIAEYLSRGGDTCILNKPTNQIRLTSLQLTADEQCHTAMGPASRVVPSHTTCGALVCSIPDSRSFRILNMPMQDGTKCSISARTNGECISGVCVRVDCNGELSGDAQLDACGVCNGDGTSCHMVSGTVSLDLPNFNLYQLFSIPSEARDVTLIHLTPSSNVYLYATQTGQNLYYLLKQNPIINGAKWLSARLSNGSRTFSTLGPISDSLDIVAYGGPAQVALFYSYSLPLVQAARLASEEAFHWVADSLCHSCNATCGNAVAECVAECFDVNNYPVSPLLCDRNTKPLDTSTPCTDLPPCPSYIWASLSWGPCSATCGMGYKIRNTLCFSRTQDNYQLTLESNCIAGERPKSSLSCWQPCPTT